MNSRTTQEIDELVANGDRLVAEAGEMLAASARLFEAHGVDPAANLALLREVGGEEAVHAVECQVEEEIRRIEEDVHRRLLHAGLAQPSGKRPRMRRNMI